MKKFINIMISISATISSLVILGTFLTLHNFYNLGQMFNSHRAIQIGVAITMFFLAMRFWQNEHGNKKIIFSAVSLTISILLLISISIV